MEADERTSPCLRDTVHRSGIVKRSQNYALVGKYQDASDSRTTAYSDSAGGLGQILSSMFVASAVAVVARFWETSEKAARRLDSSRRGIY